MTDRPAAHVRILGPDQASGELQTLYRPWLERLGYVPRIVQALSVRPELVAAVDGWRRAIGHGSSLLGRRREELIAISIADQLRCFY